MLYTFVPSLVAGIVLDSLRELMRHGDINIHQLSKISRLEKRDEISLDLFLIESFDSVEIISH